MPSRHNSIGKRPIYFECIWEPLFQIYCHRHNRDEPGTSDPRSGELLSNHEAGKESRGAYTENYSGESETESLSETKWNSLL